MPGWRWLVVGHLALLALPGAPAFAQEAAGAPRSLSASAPAGGPRSAPSPGPGGLDEPTAATVAPTAGQAAQAEGADTKALAKLLGLDEAPVTVYGWLQNSYTGTPGIDPRNRSTVTVFPNRLANEWQGNQYYLVVEDPVETGDRANLGFRVDTLLGNDWLFTKSFGLFDGAFTPRGFAGVDFPQLYGEARLPLGENVALGVKGGRFYSPAGFESVMAVKRPLLSVPYILNFTPFTFFGALTSLQLGERLTLVNGAVNGADRWINSNYRYSYLGGVNWNSADGRTTLSSMTLVGPNQLPFFPSTDPQQVPTLPVGAYTSPELAGRRNPFYGRSTLVYHSTVATRKWGEKKRWTQAMEAAFVTQGNVVGFGPGGKPGRISYYGGAHWLLFEATPKVTAVSRIEVFRDDNGFVLPAADTYYEMTHGLICKPRPALWIRPEIRYDWAQFTTPYDDGTRGGQLTLAFDVIVQF
ncbi:outer membrane beta-barrel protein [Paludisphaera sp.]|uniref:outer membrane beta-barrel protein n=1 Tax=Paludisphaera sp. TaxID=2017432 RepID=UPI00301DBC89